MRDAINIYQNNAKQTQAPRELEASLLLKAASQLQFIKENWQDEWDNANNSFLTALYYNRRLWGVFLSSIASEENPLPQEIKNNVASLGAFVLHHTVTVQAHPSPDKLETLININRQLAEGLNAVAA